MKIILAIIVFFILFSCSHKSSDLNNNNDPEISFDLDSVHYDYKGQTTGSGYGVDGSKPAVTNSSDTYYTFSGATNSANSITLKIITPNDSLKPSNYHYVFSSQSADPHTATINIQISTLVYNMISDGDFADITITGYQSGIVNGNFNGQVSRLVSVNPLLIKTYIATNGSMKNVRIRYY